VRIAATSKRLSVSAELISSTPWRTQRSAISAGGSAQGVPPRSRRGHATTRRWRRHRRDRRSGRDDELHVASARSRKHLLELAPAGDVACLEGAAGGEGRAGIGVLAEHHDPDGVGSNPVEGAEDMACSGAPGNRRPRRAGKTGSQASKVRAGSIAFIAELAAIDDAASQDRDPPAIRKDLPHRRPSAAIIDRE